MDKNQEKPAFYFDVEIKRRDLLSRLTMAALLADKGYHVFIGDVSTFDSLNGIIDNATIVKKSARSKNINEFKDFISHGFKIVNMEEEGVLIGSLNEYIGVNMPPEVVKLPEKHFLWGSEQKKHLTSLYPELSEKFYNIGNPRLCLWRDRYYGYYDELSANIKRELGEFVLISSNFALYTNKNFVKEMLGTTGYLDQSSNMDAYESNAKVVEFLYKEFVKAAKKISLNGIKVIFRPHPSESITRIKEDFKGYSNIKVDSSHDIAPWILASKAVIHNCCTSGLEAVFMKKNTIAYMPNNISQYELNGVNRIAKTVTNIDDLIKSIYSPSEFHSSKLNLNNYLTTNTVLNDIVSSLESVKTSSYFELSRLKISNNRLILNNFLYVYSRKLRDFLVLNKTKKRERRALREKFPITSASELADYLSCIYEYGLLKQPITCVPVGKNTFYIYCNNRNLD
jgi:surface carbohydrate biosynthesis protein